MGRLQKAMSFLGLADEDYDDFEPYEEPIPSGPVRVGRTAEPDPTASLRAIGTRDEGVTPLPQGVVPRPVVRPVAAPKSSNKVHVVIINEFKDCEEVGVHAREGDFVIVNMQSVPNELARRVTDFIAGLSFGLGGKMEKTAAKVFLLRPTDSDMSDDEKARLAERGLYS
ncbi:MAG: cell division inhibitor SepF [Actinomycetota bacterium]|jgi:cell division inhibitor SepF